MMRLSSPAFSEQLISGVTFLVLLTSGIDMEGELIRSARVALFSPKLAQIRKDLNKYASADDIYAAAQDHIDMQTMSIEEHDTSSAQLGTRRMDIYEYSDSRRRNPLSVDDFIREVVRILGLMPENGLILDVRGNPGGLIVSVKSCCSYLRLAPSKPRDSSL